MVFRLWFFVVCFYPSLTAANRRQSKELLDARTKAFDYLISKRSPITFGWENGRTPAVILGLLSARPTWIAKNGNLENANLDGLITVKQLEIEVLAILNKDLKLRHIDSANLALYVGALQATCFNLRDFHGVNLLEIVKERLVDTPATSPAFASLILILCNDRVIVSLNTLRKLGNSFKLGSRCAFCVETAAMNVQALVCVGRTVNEDATNYRKLVKRLKVQNRRYIDSVQDKNTGSFGDVISTSLALQAKHLTWKGRNFDDELATNYLLSQRRADGSFSGSTLITTLTIPALSMNTGVTGGTLLNCPSRQTQRSNDTIKVIYQLRDQVYTKQSITGSFVTKRNFSLYEALKEYSLKNPDIFKLKVIRSSVGIQIKSINQLVNDVSTRTFWKVSEIKNISGVPREYELIGRGLEKIQLEDDVVYKFSYCLLQ